MSADSESTMADSESTMADSEMKRLLDTIVRVDIIELGETGEGKPSRRSPVAQYTEIKNVSLVEKDPLYSVALKEWDRKSAQFEERADRSEKNITDLNNHVFNMVGFFSVFQGVVLTTVTQLTSDKHDTCGIVWFPIALSIVALGASVYGVSLKFSNLAKVEKNLGDFRKYRATCETWANKLRASGRDNFLFYEDTGDIPLHKREDFSMNRFFVIFGMIFFTILLIMSYLAILCDLLDFLHLKGGFGAVGRAPTPAA